MEKVNFNFKSFTLILISLFVMMMVSSCGIIYDEVALDTPKNLRVVNVTHDSAVIMWDKVPNAFDYEVFGKNISTGEECFIYFPDVTRVEVENLAWDETYEVKIKARASGTIWDKYTYSDTVKISFKTGMPGVPEGELKRPLNLQSVYEDGKVLFSWDKVDGADSYVVKCEYYLPYNNFDRHDSDRIEPVFADQNYLIDDKLPEDVSKVCYQVYARSNANPEMKNWSKKNFIRIKNK